MIPGLVKIGTDVQAILQFGLRNLNGCNVGITEGTDLGSALLRWPQVAQ
jgi:hypothetical protein